MNRRQFVSLAFIGGQAGKVATTMPKDPPPKPPTRCPRCGREEYRTYRVPIAAVRNKAVTLLGCKECRTLFEPAGLEDK